MSSVAILGYWDIRGLAESIRLLLEHTGTEYEDRRVHMTKPTWLDYKQGLGFDFPNLPYFQEGEFKLTQSLAILRYLGRKSGLIGTSELELSRVDLLGDVLTDYRGHLTSLCYNADFTPSMIDSWKSTSGLVERLKSLEKFFLSSSGNWWAGENLTWVDFLAWEFLDQHRILIPGCLEGMDGIKGFMERFSSLPNVASYLARPTYRSFPIWSVRAKYGFYPI